MAEAYPFQILCPDGVITQGEAGMIVMPGVDGDMGVMLRHSAMIVQLRRGTVAVFQDGKAVSERFYVDGGTAHVTPESLLILSDLACDLENLQEGNINQDYPERAEAQILALKSPVYG